MIYSTIVSVSSYNLLILFTQTLLQYWHLPGYQFVWNIHNPNHCHVFHSILSGPAPWLFAHVYLPTKKSISSSSEGNKGEENNTLDNIQSYNDIQGMLKCNDAPLYGTLLRITDRRFQDDDGRIVLAVQAIDRVRVHNVASLPGTNLHTNVQMSPEREVMRSYYDKALLSSASYSSSIEGESNALSCPSAISGAARAAAVADTLRIRKFEYLPIFLEETPRPSSSSILKDKPNDTKVKKKVKDAIRKQDKEQMKESSPEYVSVVQLCNYCAFEWASLSNEDTVVSQALKAYWKHLAEESKSQGVSTEDDMFPDNSDTTSTPPFLPEPITPSNQQPVSVEDIDKLEYKVWKNLDEMIRLLSMAASATVPLPSQLLGLLPKRDDWGHEFALESYAHSLRTSGSSIGTTFKSPFVRVDEITSSSNPSSEYSPLRRAQRLSYSIWLLLDGLSMTGVQPPPPSRDMILAMDIEQRLIAAIQTLEGINSILRRMIPENRKDGDEKR